jgi:membrane protein implicated in regulation of membrane protease activity
MKLKYSSNGGLMLILLIVLAAIFLVAIGPLIIIWSLNTLFPVLAIPYDIWAWLAVVFLGVFLRANVSVKRQD